MTDFYNYKLPYRVDPRYKKRAAYFCMEYAIDQSLKTYSGGLGFLSGSHMKSAYELKQNLIGIGILWKYGYYDQERDKEGLMKASYIKKNYSFLEDTKIRFEIHVHSHPVKVKVLYLKPETFNTAPVFFLSTDVEENDHLSKTISHYLYDSDKAARIAASILLGIGGGKLLEILSYNTEIYHLNEAHALPLAFYLYQRSLGELSEVKNKLTFTTHTPEEAGNEKSDFALLNQMGFFYGLKEEETRKITSINSNTFDHTLAALRLSKIANAVSKKHKEVSAKMWKDKAGICNITSITNAQNKSFWANKDLYKAAKKSVKQLLTIKKSLKQDLFETIADQTGKLFDPEKLTIVWARRFAEYKRADLITRNKESFEKMMNSKDFPIQIVWAGKPYPKDEEAIQIFKKLQKMSVYYENCAVLTGYELALSHQLKMGADIWLNTPRIPREASGTSGMTAGMNGAINLSTQDGWVLEFAKDAVNSFILPLPKEGLSQPEVDEYDAKKLKETLLGHIIPMYYEDKQKWAIIIKNSLEHVIPYFDSSRMAEEYYKCIYNL